MSDVEGWHGHERIGLLSCDSSSKRGKSSMRSVHSRQPSLISRTIDHLSSRYLLRRLVLHRTRLEFRLTFKILYLLQVDLR